MSDEKVQRAARLCIAVGLTIRDTGPIPSGFLYMVLAERGCTIEIYTFIIDTLKRNGLVTESNHVLTWKGK